MLLRVLGSGGIHPNPERKGPAFLLCADQTKLLLDIGPGTLHSLVKAGIAPNQIDGICLTHRHVDHHAEFGYFLEILRNQKRTQPLFVFGNDIWDELIDFHFSFGRSQKAIPPYSLPRGLMPGKHEFGPFSITGSLVRHVNESIGYRIQTSGMTLVYSGDCGPGTEIIGLADQADLLILECTLDFNQKLDVHLAPEDVLYIARQSRCQNLLVTHFPPSSNADVIVAYLKKHGIRAQAAQDGQCIDLNELLPLYK